MIRTIFILLGFLFTFCSCNNKKSSNYPEYYRQYNEVLRLEKDNKIMEAFENFIEAEKLVDFVPVQHLLKARNFASVTMRCDLVLHYFQKAVNNGFEHELFEYSYGGCPEINNSSVGGNKFDKEYKKEIMEMYSLDQRARSSRDREKMKEVDSINIIRLMDLINKKGFPSSKLIGNKTADKAFILLLHYDSDIGNKTLKPILEYAYNNGMISPENYAWIIDRRRHWGPEKLDPYYYQLPSEKFFDMTEEEINIIDLRRDSIGLRRMSEMGISRTENGGISIQNY